MNLSFTILVVEYELVSILIIIIFEAISVMFCFVTVAIIVQCSTLLIFKIILLSVFFTHFSDEFGKIYYLIYTNMNRVLNVHLHVIN